MVSLSVEVWQDLQPRLLLMASSRESPNTSGACPEARWTFSWGCGEFAQPTVKRPPRNKQASDTEDSTDQERGFLLIFMNADLYSVSKLEPHGGKPGDQCFAGIDLAQAQSRSKRRHSAGHYYILRKPGAINDSHAVVCADVLVDVGLEQQQLQRLGVVEAHVVQIGHGAQVGREIEVRACIHQEDTWVHKAGLPFFLAGAQVRQKTVGRHQAHSSTGQPDSLTIEKAED